VLDLVDQVAGIAAKRPDDSGAQHIHAALVGELVCWTLLTMVTSEIAHRSAMHGYTASWTEHQLGRRLRNAQLGPHRNLPTLTEFADHVAGFVDVIGDVDQRRWPAEEWRGDPLLQ
jgi:hypothetical protein